MKLCIEGIEIELDYTCSHCYGLGYSVIKKKQLECIYCGGKGKLLTSEGRDLVDFFNRWLKS